MTRSSTTVSLFAEPSNSPRRPSSIVLSMFAHAAIAGVVYYGVTHLPPIKERALLEHYSVRRIDVLDPNFPRMPDFHQAENKIPYPAADVIRQLNRAPSPQLTEEMRSFLGQAAGRETLIQPDIRSRLSFAAGGSGREPSVLHRGDGGKPEDFDNIAKDGRRLSTEHVVLPKNGRFSVVAVGSSLAEEYPQTADIWADRVAYTAYLHVGLRKSWILQYAATRVAEMAEGGRVERVDAPWPYDILRPNLLSRDVHAHALMVHGVLNQAGRLESLAVAFPNSFRYTSFVLRALSQWQFRPAVRNGQATPVEVLLIIPEEMD